MLLLVWNFVFEYAAASAI